MRYPRFITPFVTTLFTVSAVAGTERRILVAGGGDGPEGTSAVLAQSIASFGVDFTYDGTLIFSKKWLVGERLRTIDSSRILQTLVGTGLRGDARFNREDLLV
jgi:hypothetical protein